MIGTKPYAKLKYREVKGRQMAYIDDGEGDAIVFQHGQPAASCVWRNVMPHLEGRCRLIACDLIGMGRSEKLSPSGPDRYRYSEHRNDSSIDVQFDTGFLPLWRSSSTTCPALSRAE